MDWLYALRIKADRFLRKIGYLRMRPEWLREEV